MGGRRGQSDTVCTLICPVWGRIQPNWSPTRFIPRATPIFGSSGWRCGPSLSGLAHPNPGSMVRGFVRKISVPACSHGVYKQPFIPLTLAVSGQRLFGFLCFLRVVPESACSGFGMLTANPTTPVATLFSGLVKRQGRGLFGERARADISYRPYE